MPAALERVSDGDWDRVRLNTDVTASLLNPPVPQARVYNNANINLPTSGTFAVLTFNTERYDNGALHSTSVNTSRLIAPITGLYTGGCSVTFASNATGRREVVVQLNATTNIAYDAIPAVNGAQTRMSVPFEWQMVAGDYLEVYAMQTSGGALNVETGAAFTPEFWMHRVAGYVNQGV